MADVNGSTPKEPAAATAVASVNGNSRVEVDVLKTVKAVEREYQVPPQRMGTRRKLRVIFVGMGASGINFSYQVQKRMSNIDLQIYEKNDQIGGTWYENRYPGCACDIPSVGYQFSWSRKPDWSQYYSGSKEILAYFQALAKDNDLEKYAKLKHEIVGAYWQEEQGQWKILVMRNNDPNDVIVDYADFFINGGGVLNNWRWPAVPGLKDFKGALAHSANWDESIELKGKRVCIIGSGSSGVQIVPSIIDEVEHVYMFARSPTWITAGFAPAFAGPNGDNFFYTEELKKKFSTDPEYYLKYCKAVESELCNLFSLYMAGTPESLAAREFSIKQMSEKLQYRSDLIEALIPKDFDVGCRRPTPGNGFLEALVTPKATLFSEQIAAITEKGFRRANGEEIECDVIVCATGFDTSFRPRFPLFARGRNLQDEYDNHVTSYLGLGAPEVPNYFVIQGPYSSLAQGSVLPLIEVCTNYFLQAIEKVQLSGNIKSIQPSRKACDDYAEHADAFLQKTVFVGPCPSWFKAGTTTKRPLIWPGSRIHSLAAIETPLYEDYDIEYHGGNRFGWLGNGFDVREIDGRDLTWYYGLLNGEDKQPPPFTL